MKAIVFKSNPTNIRNSFTNFFIKFSHLGNFENLHIEVFADASLGNAEKDGQTKSVMGYFIALSNNDLKTSPLLWKSKVIDKVAEDIKTAETLALETAIDDSLHLGDLIAEIYIIGFY